MNWEIRDDKLIQTGNAQYDLRPHEFWYVLPARSHYSSEEGKRVRPLEFAFVLHNAHLAKGLLISPSAFAKSVGFVPRSLKNGSAAEAETILELVRKEHFPDRPSRLSCHFLNANKSVAA